MEQYIAFLRGINVGGKNTVSMPVLKSIFLEHGFYNVGTYINSGNILFASETVQEEKLKEQCETLIYDKLHLSIPVTILSVKDLREALNHAPLWWGQEETSKHNAIIVIPPVTVDEIFKEVGESKPEYEKVDYYGKIIFWSAPFETFSRTRWSKIVGTSAYNSITIRNANTVRKLLQLADK